MDNNVQRDLPHNFFVNVMDGAFFGWATGVASFVAVIPLFVSRMTDSAILIGLIPAIHAVGWQLPQLLMANRVSRLNRFKPMVVALTALERLPFLGLAVVAFFLRGLSREIALVLTFILLIIQGLGGGFTATAWQSMIAKLFPANRRGTFYGMQAAAASLFSSFGALIAGIALEQMSDSANYVFCFALAFCAMLVSWGFLASTHELPSPVVDAAPSTDAFRVSLRTILRRDGNFRWFLVMRMLAQVATMAFAFYTVYAVRHHNVSVESIGVMTAVYMGTQIVANPVMGWVGDHWSHRTVLEFGALSAIASALLAAVAPSADWFYLVFILAGIANVTIWTITLTMILDFAPEPSQRPAYVGLANTLVAPFTILAPLCGGWLADVAGYSITFIVAAGGGVLTEFVLRVMLRDPRHMAMPEPNPVTPRP